MKILIVGSDKVYSIENYYFKYVKELGEEVHIFTAQAIFYDYYFKKGIINKLLYKLGLSNIMQKINAQFKENVNQLEPDIIWVFKGMEITPSSLKWAKQKGIKLVNYNPDNPFIFTGKGSGNANITKSINLYDFHFTYNLEIKKEIENRYNLPTVFLPFGFDISDELYIECSKQEEVLKTCFLGNPDKQRADYIIQLANKGVLLDVYGNDWQIFLKHKNITIYNPVLGNELWKVLRKYRVQINMMRIHNEDSHNMRSFELPGIAGLQVAPNTKEHQLFFKDGKEIFLYNNVDECVSKINYLLGLNIYEVNKLRAAAREKAINGKHSYKDRAIFVLQELQKII
jgi:spore maturation protein CgeB